jgi:phosphate starvation-inducible protein PhoH
MAANAQNAFRTALQRIGINAQMHDVINHNGFETILDLATVQEEDLNKLPKHLEAWRDAAAAAPNHQVQVPSVSLKKLKAMCYWVLAQRCFSVQNP